MICVESAVSPSTAIALIQNGIGIEDSVASDFPDNTLITGIAHTGVSQAVPGVIEHHVQLKIGIVSAHFQLLKLLIITEKPYLMAGKDCSGIKLGGDWLLSH